MDGNMNLKFINASSFGCSLTEGELVAREKLVRATVTSTFESYEEIETGFAFEYEHSQQMAHTLLDFIIAEGECCSFIDFDLSFKTSEKKIVCRVTTTKRDPNEFKKGLRSFYAM